MTRKNFVLTQLLCAAALWCAAIASGQSSNPAEDDGAMLNSFSVHQQQQIELGDILKQPPETEEGAQPAPGVKLAAPGLAAGAPSIDTNFINFGYIQNEGVLPHVRWNSLTHVGSIFIPFDANGNLTGTFSSRNSALKAGGAAQNAGVKVIMVVQNFDDAPGGDIEQVMTNSTKRQTLITDIINTLNADGYVQGVSFDWEFSWGTTVRDGIATFLTALRTQLPSQYEISVYVGSIYSSSQWNATNLGTTCNYVLLSGYDYASGNTAHAITDHNNNITQINNWIDAGVPTEKMVYVISSYSRRWSGITTYNAVGSSPASQGFCDGLYDTTLEPQFSGPYTNNYQTGDEAAWYTYNDGTNRVVTWDDPQAVEYKVRSVRAWIDTGGPNSGRRLGGVGWWSLYWMANFSSSYNPIAAATQTRRRTYPHIYQICQEVLHAPGDTLYVFEGFEGLDPRWADPNESPDESGDTDNDSGVVLVNSPTGSGQPAKTTKAAQLTFDFESASGNRIFFRHEVLNDNGDTAVTDLNATAAHVDRNTAFICPIYVSANYSPKTTCKPAATRKRIEA
ncbi:MAG: glycoside hydrolase family 18 protein [bacterium]